MISLPTVNSPMVSFVDSALPDHNAPDRQRSNR
jgi:hypothetical protein